MPPSVNEVESSALNLDLLAAGNRLHNDLAFVLAVLLIQVSEAQDVTTRAVVAVFRVGIQVNDDLPGLRRKFARDGIAALINVYTKSAVTEHATNTGELRDNRHALRVGAPGSGVITLGLASTRHIRHLCGLVFAGNRREFPAHPTFLLHQIVYGHSYSH